MPRGDWPVLMIVGGAFVIFGIVAIIWGRREEESYYGALIRRPDVREFLDHWPPRIEPWALKLGGLVAIVVGLGVIGLGAAFILWK